MNQLDQIMELTRQVEAQVDAGEWAEASELETRRRTLMADLAASAQDPEGVHGLFAQLSGRNDQMVDKITAYRQDLERQQGQLQRGTDAVYAYLTNTAPKRG